MRPDVPNLLRFVDSLRDVVRYLSAETVASTKVVYESDLISGTGVS